MPNWKKVIISGSDAALNSLEITSHLTASGLIYPTADGTDGQAIITDAAGNLTFGNPGLADEAERVTFEVQNGDTGTLAKGTPVHITSMTGGTAIVVAASASVASKMPSHGILNQQLTVGSDGFATILGQVAGVDTSAFSPGDTVYVGPFGGYVNVKPTGSTNLIQNLGVVKKVDALNGTGEIFGSGRTNDVPNLPTGKIWVGDSYTVTSSVVYLDEPNGRMGIGTTSPAEKLTVEGNISGSGDITMIGTGSFSDGRFSGNVGIGTASPDEKLVVTGTIRSAGSGSIQTDRNFVLAPFGYKGGIYADQLLTGNPSDSLNDIVLYSANGSIHLTEGATTNKVLTVSGSSVGIGTTSPDATLDVVSSVNGINAVVENDTHNAIVQILASSNAKNSELWFGDSVDSNIGKIDYDHANNSMTFTTFAGERMHITSAGNVGIGTTNPSRKLDVDGEAAISGSLELYDGALFVSGSNDSTFIDGDGVITLGYESQPVQLNRNKYVLVNSGPDVVATVDSTLHLSAHFDYVIVKLPNLRAGTVMACHDSLGNVVFTETATSDLGSTAGVTLDVVESGGNLELQMTVPSTGWFIKTFVRAI